MDYNYGLCGLLNYSCIWFQMNVAYISMFEHVVLRLNIHLIIVYGLNPKRGEIMSKFFASSSYYSATSVFSVN